MFHTVLNALDVSKSDYRHVAMVGNNLPRDIAGANRLGLISIFQSWSKRRSHTPANADENPDYTITDPAGLIPMLEQIELNLPESE